MAILPGQPVQPVPEWQIILNFNAVRDEGDGSGANWIFLMHESSSQITHQYINTPNFL